MWFISLIGSSGNPNNSWWYPNKVRSIWRPWLSLLTSKSPITVTYKVLTDILFANQLYKYFIDTNTITIICKGTMNIQKHHCMFTIMIMFSYILRWYYYILQNNAEPPCSCSPNNTQRRNETEDNYQVYFNWNYISKYMYCNKQYMYKF